MPEDRSPGRKRQKEIFVRGLAGVRPRVPVDPGALERAARRAMSAEAFAYAAGGAGLEATAAANRSAFDRWRILPRMLRGSDPRDLSVTLLGRTHPTPLFLAPIGVLEMAHADADLAVARAAGAEGVPMVVSSQGSWPLEACAEASGDAPCWFQLYWNRSREVVTSFVRRAEAAGYEAIVLTVDTSLLAWRPRDLDLAYLPFLRGRGLAQYTSDPAFRAERDGGDESAREVAAEATARPPLRMRTVRSLLELVSRHPGSMLANLRSGRARATVQRFIDSFPHPGLQWEDVTFLRGVTELPVLLKGILHPDDAARAVEAGVDGVIVSNHGGRQLDGAVGALDALPGVVGAVGGRVPVLMDSGVRCGADVFKALALGAAAVGVGRPYMYGLAVAGEEGVREVIRNFAAELDLTMAIAGCGSVDEIGREMLTPSEG